MFYYTVVVNRIGSIDICFDDSQDPFWCATLKGAERFKESLQEMFPENKYDIYRMSRVF